MSLLQVSDAAVAEEVLEDTGVLTPTRSEQDEGEEEKDTIEVVTVLPCPADDFTFIKVWRQTLRKMLRSAAYAGIARLMFGILKSAVKSGGSRRKFVQFARSEIFSLNPIKWAALISSLTSYRGVQQTISRALPIPHAVSSALAGAIASLGVFVMNVSTRTDLALYLGARAAHGMGMSHLYPALPASMQRFSHWDSVVMSLTAMQIMYCLMFEGTCNAESYQNFLVKCTTADPRVLATASALQRKIICPEMVDYAKQHNLPILGKEVVKQSCTFMHEGSSCAVCMAQFIVKHLTQFSLPLYVPLKLTTTFTFGFSKASKAPLKSFAKALISAFKSSAFLTSYCIPPWGIICLFANLGLQNPGLMGMGAGLLAGFATLLEPKGRRLDLAIYCSMQAFRSMVLLLVRRGWIPHPTRHHITLLSLAAFAAMFYQFDHEPKQLHPNVCKSLSWITAEKKLRVSVEKRKHVHLLVPPPVEVLGDGSMSDAEYSCDSSVIVPSSMTSDTHHSLSSLAHHHNHHHRGSGGGHQATSQHVHSFQPHILNPQHPGGTEGGHHLQQQQHASPPMQQVCSWTNLGDSPITEGEEEEGTSSPTEAATRGGEERSEAQH